MTDLLILALASSRLARLVVYDFITERIRVWIWKRWPGSGTEFGDSEVDADGTDALGYQIGMVKDTGVQVFRGPDSWLPVKARFIGNLIECHWCAGIWVAFATWTAFTLYPDVIWVAVPLAFAEVVGLLNDRNE